MNKTYIFIIIFLSITLFGQKPYRGAEYRSIENYQYGRFEIRMKSALGSGVVSSFFTIRDYWAEGLSDPSNWREIDFESLGQYTNKFQTNIITAHETSHEELHTLLYNPHVGFHTYAFEWTPEHVRFFIDNQLVRSDENNYIGTLNTGQKIMMNIWQPIWENWVGEFDESILPIYAFYDWVKYYSYQPGEGDYGTSNNFLFEWIDEFNFFDQTRWQKATHTWTANNAQFIQENAVLQNGYLILCLTDDESFGYSGDPLKTISNIKVNASDIINVYPNPFNSSFTVQFPESMNQNINNIKLYDLNGKLVFSTDRTLLMNGTINIPLESKQLSSGLYYGVITTISKKHYFKLTYLR